MARGCSWKVNGNPRGGWDELTFAIALHEYPPEKQWFPAFQWTFVGENGPTAYTGVQPAPGGMLDLRFSVFGSGSTPVDTELCSGGADGGSGVTCDGASVPLNRNNTYWLRVFRDAPGSRVWRGEVTDTGTGLTVPTGAWEIAGDGGLPSWGSFWMEHYKSCACDRMPMLSLHTGPVFNAPSGTSGRCYDPADGGGCVGKSNFAAVEKSDGRTWIRAGWEGVSCWDKRRNPGPCCGGRDDVAVTVNINVRNG